MNTSAIILMMLSMGIVTLLTGYFLYRVLTADKRPEPDSYDDNE